MEKRTNQILWFALGGVAVGTLLGILFAPAKGSETRKKIRESGTKLSDNVRETFRKGREGLHSLKENIKERMESIDEQTNEYI